MLRQVAAPLALVAAGIVVLALFGHDVAGEAVAVTLIGIAGVLALSLTFLAVGRSEDAERRAGESPSSPPPDPRSPKPPAPGHEHDRPALERRRSLPPRRPS